MLSIDPRIDETRPAPWPPSYSRRNARSTAFSAPCAVAKDHMIRRSSNGGDISFVVEELRLAGYVGFWLIVLTGMVLTRLYSGIDMDQTILTRVFGYNNICVYFDFAPATHVLPFLWAVTLVMLLCYLGAQWLQMRAEVQQRELTPRLYSVLTKLKVFEATMLLAFSTIFAVQPEEWNHTLLIHTAPFVMLQIGLVSLAISNTVHGIKSGYWSSLALPSWFIPGAKLYVVGFAIVVCFKIPHPTPPQQLPTARLFCSVLRRWNGAQAVAWNASKLWGHIGQTPHPPTSARSPSDSLFSRPECSARFAGLLTIAY